MFASVLNRSITCSIHSKNTKRRKLDKSKLCTVDKQDTKVCTFNYISQTRRDDISVTVKEDAETIVIKTRVRIYNRETEPVKEKVFLHVHSKN